MPQAALGKSCLPVAAAAAALLIAGLVGADPVQRVLPLTVSDASADESAKLLEHKGQWESGYGATFYNVVGKLKNTSGHALAYVKIRVDALDGAGKVVASADAYNESAEALSLPGAQPEKVLASGKVKPLPAASEERFRASFLKEDAPDLVSYRAQVIEAPAAK
jgi:hypothetical protein